MRPTVCVGAIALHSGRLLLIRRATPPGAGEWSVPGGRVEPDELLAEAVVRELREETGLEGVCGELVGVAERMSEHGHFVILDYEVTVLDERSPHAASDAADVAWVPLEDVSELRLVDGLAEFLHDHGILRTIV
jgi:8-oxo-dGTP diphosphatase